MDSYHLEIDVTEIAGTRLYYQALELSKKIAARRALENGPVVTEAINQNNNSKNANSGKDKIDVTEIAGARLYHQAVESSKKLAARREVEQIFKEPLARKVESFLQEDQVKERKIYTAPETAKKCSDRLYSLSKKEQAAGKQRREAIAEAARRRRAPARHDYGVLASDKASNMYNKGVRKTHEREAYLISLRQIVNDQIRKNHEFSLAKGAFARCSDPEFQARLEYRSSRHGTFVEAARRRRAPARHDYGVLASDKASNMYNKGVRKTHEREAYLISLRQIVNDQIRKNHEFSLAKGAFARCSDPEFQARLEYSRYGTFVEFDDEEVEVATSVIGSPSVASRQESRQEFPEYENNNVARIPVSIITSSSKSQASRRSIGSTYTYASKLVKTKEERLAQLINNY